MMGRTGCISTTMMMAALSDTKSLYPLSKIAVVDGDSRFLLAESKLSPKAFYWRISRLLKVGIISRKDGKYSLTSIGKIVYQAQDHITGALNNYWRRIALDSISMLDALPIEEYNNISNTLLGEQHLKKAIAEHLGQITNNESLICLTTIPTSTHGSRDTAGGPQAT